MPASNLYLKVPTQYEPSSIREIVQALCLQLDSLSTGQTTARFSSLNATPSGSVAPHAVSDLIYDLNATVQASLVPGLPLSYVRLGWIWNVAGNPGTFQEIRVPTGALSNSVPNNVALASNGAGGFGFRTLTTADVPASSNSLFSATTALGADVAINNTANYFDGPSQSVVAGVGTYYVSATVSFKNTAAAANLWGKIWDGTSLINSGNLTTGAANFVGSMTLTGVITNPAGNIRFSGKDAGSTASAFIFNASGNSRDCNLTVVRIA